MACFIFKNTMDYVLSFKKSRNKKRKVLSLFYYSKIEAKNLFFISNSLESYMHSRVEFALTRAEL